MRRLTTMVMATVLVLAVAGPASAHNAGRGFLPPNARVHGYTLTDLAVAWNIWAFDAPEAGNPLANPRCEQSSFDKKIWFLPVSLGGVHELDCVIPQGAFLVVTPGGWFCDPVEAGGGSEAQLQACSIASFPLLTKAEVALDGRLARHLDRYVVTTPRIELAGPNLLSDNPTSIAETFWFLVVHPLSRGQHTIWAYDEAASFGFTAGFTFNLTVK